MLEVPSELPGVGPERQGRRGVERLVVAGRAAARLHPGFGLRHAPIGQIEIGIVAAGDPGIAACAQHVGKLAPGVAAGRAFAGRGIEAPEVLRSGLCVIAADEAGLVFSSALYHSQPPSPWTILPLMTIGPRRIAKALGVFGDDGVPHRAPGVGIQRHDVRVRRSDVEPCRRRSRDYAWRRCRRRPPPEGRMRFSHRSSPVAASSACTILSTWTRYMMPLCTSGVGFVRARAVVHRPYPGELELVHILLGDLIERAVAPAFVAAAHHQPVVRAGILQHLVGDWDEILDVAFEIEPRGLTRRSRGVAAAATCQARPRGSTRRDLTDRHGSRDVNAWAPAGAPFCRRMNATMRAHRLVCERARIVRRHRADDLGVEIVGRTPAPCAHKSLPGQRWRFGVASQVRLMARGTDRLIGRRADRHLVRREHRTVRGLRLSGRDPDAERGGGRACKEERSLQSPHDGLLEVGLGRRLAARRGALNGGGG